MPFSIIASTVDTLLNGVDEIADPLSSSILCCIISLFASIVYDGFA